MPYLVQTFLLNKSRLFKAVGTACMSFGISFGLVSTASAQDQNNVDVIGSSKVVQATDGLSFNLPGPASFAAQAGPQLELPLEAVGSTVFKIDLSSPSCVNGSESCLNQDDNLRVGLTDTFNRHSEKGLDLSLTPRASVKFNDEVSSTAVGAVIKIGEDLREGSEFKSNTWYFFAGADAEALTYSPESVDRIASGEFHLQDRIIVGDAQAGLGYRIGDADLSLSYMRREASSEDFKFKEDAATLSFTWKR